jgi:hypothetical protein
VDMEGIFSKRFMSVRIGSRFVLISIIPGIEKVLLTSHFRLVEDDLLWMIQEMWTKLIN